MLATIVSDKFLTEERELIANSLDEICPPDHNWGWSSGGIYSFWNARTSEILYIGLAVDLPRRFREHTGIIQCAPTGCKKSKIDEYFQLNPGAPLGYSILLQSRCDQPGESFLGMLFPELGDTGTRTIKTNEGLFIEAYRKAHGKLPAWNQIGGSQSGAKHAKPGHVPLLRFLSEVEKECPFRAELPLRELAKDDNAPRVTEELELHLIRMYALNHVGDLKTALEIHRNIQRANPDSAEVLSRDACKRWIAKWCN